MANYKNQNVITEISVEKIKHQSGVEESWMQPFSWDKMTMNIRFICIYLNGQDKDIMIILLLT